jgi:hypothetical protein
MAKSNTDLGPLRRGQISFDKSGARAMCTSVQTRSKDGCIAYSVAKPLPGTIS